MAPDLPAGQAVGVIRFLMIAGAYMKAESNSSRPSVSLVLLSLGPLPVLEEALAVVLPACRICGVPLLVARVPGPGERSASVTGEDIEFLFAADHTSEAELRRLALQRTAADIVTFVQDSRAADFAWVDLLQERAGMVRPPVHGPLGGTLPAGLEGRS
jgi:hypothetical protein